ncbi:hypothetical protein OM169_15350 [Escherichia albertii]|nr:hypothetical protein [Escherichia albertii]
MRDHEWVNDIRGHSTQFSITPSYDSPLPENITFIHDSEKYIFVPLGGDPHKKDKKGRLIYEYGEVTMSSDYGATWENINLLVEPATSDTRLTFHDGQLFIDDRDGFYLSQIRFIVFLCIITIITVGIMILICQEMYLLLKIIEAGITCSVQRMQNCLWKKWNVFNKIAKEAGIPGAEKVMKKNNK